MTHVANTPLHEISTDEFRRSWAVEQLLKNKTSVLHPDDVSSTLATAARLAHFIETGEVELPKTGDKLLKEAAENFAANVSSAEEVERRRHPSMHGSGISSTEL